jgi:type II secretory pathway component PulJ
MRRKARPAGRFHRRSGFTLVETMLVSALMIFLAGLISATWAGLGRPTTDLVVRSRLAHEASLAVASLTRDLGGSLANNEGRLGGKTQARFVGRMQPSSSQLWLCFDGGADPNGMADWGPPDTVIVYEVQANSIVRWDQTANTTFTVARHVDRLDLLDLGDRVQIQLTFKYRKAIQVYTLIARNP